MNRSARTEKMSTAGGAVVHHYCDHMADQVTLDITNSGGGQFDVHYASADKQASFYFPATPIDQMTFSGSAGFQGAQLDDPFVGGATGTTSQRIIGHRVSVHYQPDNDGDKKQKRQTYVGRVVQLDDDALVLDTGDRGLVTLRSAWATAIQAIDLPGAPQLALQLATPGGDLSVQGRDPHFRFRAHHVLLLHPTGKADGSAAAVLTTQAIVSTGYQWPIPVSQLTLTEVQQPPQYEARASYESEGATAMMKTTAAPAPSRQSVGASEQTGSVTLKHAVVLGSSTAGDTLLMVGERRFERARWYLLAEMDPTMPGSGECLARVHPNFVFSLRRRDDAAPLGGFLLSGPANVQVDADPSAKGTARSPLEGGFYYDAWDADNAELYYRLAPTGLATLELCRNVEVRDDNDTQNNKYSIEREVRVSNRTPYAAVFKVYVSTGRSQRVIKSIEVVARDMAVFRYATITAFAPERPSDVNRPDVRTLGMLVAPNVTASVLKLRIEYYVRAIQ